jgi:squalene-associated FAD-dependent desaturase
VVIGGGLAGIAAALDCAAGGASVTLVEVRRRLGGAAYSFAREGLQMDNGQHVFLRCCTAYRALLARLDSERLTSVQPRLQIPVLKPGSKPTVLRRGSLPAPLQLAGALARYPHLSRRERLGAARAALGLMRLDPAEQALDRVSFGDWLARHGQGPQAVAALWDLIALPTLNLPAAQASLALSAFVFRTGLLSAADAGDIGFHEATLGETIGVPAERALRDAGVELRLGWRAERLQRTAGGLEVHTGAGADGLSAEAAVVAVPHARAATLLEPLMGERAGALRGLGSSPIVNLHVLYDRQVCDEPFAAGVGTPVQYLFDRTRAAGAPAGCQYLAVSLSGADREMGMSVAELRERYEPALRELLPRARQAKVELFLATREHAATFRAAPGTAALRPGARTGIPGLVLAGTWTATGWPATLESAVLSGHAAAAVALEELGIGAQAARAHSGSQTGVVAACSESSGALVR